MTSILLSLPTELLEQILGIAIAVHPIPAHVLVLNKFVFAIASRILYQHLDFSSTSAMARFPPMIWGSETLRKPSSIAVRLSGGEVGKGAFRQIRRLLESTRFQGVTESDNLELEDLHLCMHSTSNVAPTKSTPDICIATAMDGNPQRFKWTGPDPAHHFSIAIVAPAVDVLFAHFRTWTRLQDLHLSNIAFPGDTKGLFPILPTLRTLYIGRATLVPVAPLARLLCNPQMSLLTTVRLVDCYVESIWGPRLRRLDLEYAVVQFHTSRGKLLDEEAEQSRRRCAEILDRMRTVVRCEALTERIIGGDRVDGLGVFE
ncbi:hypothetical protein EDB84DRAFT_1272662 [Lactarius hengduanensis]|nr:hypothetical protein EDB84DRAFT_1272662 [Lactarius hengduanensis]